MGADELADKKAVADRIHEALASLDEPYRTAIVLRDLEELSSEEAAEILGTSPEAVRQRAHRARVRLREALLDLASRSDPRHLPVSRKGAVAKLRIDGPSCIALPRRRR